MSPTQQNGICAHGHAVVMPIIDKGVVRIVGDLYRRGNLKAVVPLSELPEKIHAPTPEGSVGLQGNAVFSSAADLGPFAGSAYLNRIGIESADVAIAQLPGIVVPPAPQTAVLLEGEGILVTYRRRMPLIATANLYRTCAVLIVSKSQLIEIVFSPCPERAV